MKRMLKGFMGVMLLSSISNIVADSSDVFGKTFFAQRPQGSNRPRQLVGQIHDNVVCDFECCFNGVVSAALEYTDNFNRDEIGKYLFFNGTNSMIFAGASTAPANKDVDATNFILAHDFYGTVEAKPRVQNFIIDLLFRFNLDEWLCGLYFEVDLPVNWTKWDMDLRETATNKGTTINANTFGNDMPVNAPVNSIIEAWKGEALNTTTLPLLKEKMNFAKVDGAKTKTTVADIRFALGYNFICCEHYHFGLSARAKAPSGTRPDGEFFFEPVSGNGHHTALGGGMDGHVDLWTNGCDQSFSVWFDGVIYHWFRAKQKRTFDYTNNGIGSRYLLLKKFNAAGDMVEEIVRGANITTLDAKVKVNVAGEGTLLFDYQRCGFTFDIGYNIWGRTKESVTITGEIEKNTYGIKGDTEGTTTNIMTASNTKIDGSDGGADGTAPVFIQTSDLNNESAEAPSALSHKVFAHLSYAWIECDYIPFIGLGGEVEFSGKGNRALDQWGVWLKGGFSFS